MRTRFALTAAVAATIFAMPAKAWHVWLEDYTQQAASVTETAPGVYSFTQGGFSEGAILSGSFTGTDDGFGQIVYFFGSGSLTDFSASFSGNSIVSPFTLDFDDVYGFVYTIGNPDWGTDDLDEFEGLSADNGRFAVDFGPGPFDYCNEGFDCGAVADFGAGAIPEPSSWAMLIAGFGLTGAALRRRRQKAISA